MWQRFHLRDLEQLHKQPSSIQFGWTMAIVLGAVILYAQKWLWLGVPMGLVAVTVLRPRLLEPLNRLWFVFGLLLAWVMSPVFLTLFYFLIFVPMAMVIKLCGHKPFPHRGWVKKKKRCDFVRNF